MSINSGPTRETWENIWKDTRIQRLKHSQLIYAITEIMNLDGAITLEVGCGSAVDSIEMARQRAQAFALDYSLHALEQARLQMRSTNLQVALVLGDTFKIPYPDATFDLVFSQGLLEHFSDPIPAILEQLRVAKQGGYICIDVPQTWSLLTIYKLWQIWRGTWFARWETNYSLKELEAMLRRCNLKICKSYGYMYFPPVLLGFRNLHTLDERRHLPVWISLKTKKMIESAWLWLEKRYWFYRWLACIGIIAQKNA